METCNLSLEVDSMSEIEGRSDNNRLKIHVHHDRKLLTGLYKELEEERSASVDAYINVSVYFYQCFLYASDSDAIIGIMTSCLGKLS